MIGRLNGVVTVASAPAMAAAAPATKKAAKAAKVVAVAVEPETEDDGEEPFTEDELSGMDIGDLKQIATDLGLEFAPRAKKPGMIALILDSQVDEDLEDDEELEDEEDEELEEDESEEWTKDELDAMNVGVLKALAQDMGIAVKSNVKSRLVAAILA